MRKLHLLLFALLCTLSTFAQNETWYIQVGAFDQKVDINYFNELGSDVYYSRDNYGLHRYYKGSFENESDAQKLIGEYETEGFNCVLVPSKDFGNSCRCIYIPQPTSLFNSIKNIFFDFDRSNLRTTSRQQLDELTNIMRDFPTYQVKLRAHTDAKGSNSYNEALSMRRANSAKRYLLSKGINSSRISTETFGEVNPIAKNELADGADTEVGRQFNRRVEIIIMDQDGLVLNEMVDEIEVPSELLSSN